MGHSSTKQYNIGFLGASNIARKFAQDAQKLENVKLYAVASRSLEAAEKLKSEFDMVKSYDSYEKLANDEDVDIIYVSTPNSLHKEHTLLCLSKRKAVICEKAFALSKAEAKEMVQMSRKYQVFLMEAMWTRFFPSMKKAKEWVLEDKIGKVKLLKGDFGITLDNPKDIRLQKSLGGGALLDVGIYPISFASYIMGMQPERIDASATFTEEGVDENLCMQFVYDGGQMAQLSASINAYSPRDAYIIGENGYIHMPHAWYGKIAYLYNKEGVLIDHFIDQRIEFGYNFELQEVMECLEEGKLESSTMPLKESIDIMQTLDRIRGIIGLNF